MFAVVFEVRPKPERWKAYLDLAKLLKPELERIEGFINNERFESLGTKGRMLSLSTWREEKAVVRWRTRALHHEVQEKGRFDIFEDYHLRVGEVIADTESRGQLLPQHRLDETEVGEAKGLTISAISPEPGGTVTARDLAADLGVPDAAGGVLAHEVFESIRSPGELLLLVAWRGAGAAERWVPRTPDRGRLRHRSVRVVRDYGMCDRREAPQFYPLVGQRARPRRA
jgi:heme-degrading monooxygenase HmoA